MRKVLVIAWREFKQTVFRKIFLLAVVGIPLLVMIAMGAAVAILINHEEPPLVGTVAVVDPSGDVAEAAAREFSEEQLRRDQEEQIRAAAQAASEATGPGGFPGAGGPGAMMGDNAADPLSMLRRGDVRIDIEAVTDDSEASIDSLRERVRSGELLVAALVPTSIVEPPDDDGATRSGGDDRGYRMFLSEGLGGDHASLIQRRLGEAIVTVRAQRAGIDPALARRILSRPRADARRVMESGEETSEDASRIYREIVPMVFLMLIWISVFVSGQHLMMSTIEEKSNRVMEVLLSAVSPFQLMTGKIIGHGGVGLLICLLYSSMGIAVLVTVALADLIEPMSLVYLGLYFIMAYFMIASIMAAVGSAVSDVREANVLMTPVMLILMALLMLWMPITKAPNGAIAQAFSFIPPAIPFAMIIRVNADESVPFWQIPITLIWGYVSMVAMVWGAAKIFRVGVLMYGKPPSPLELLKWVRYR